MRNDTSGCGVAECSGTLQLGASRFAQDDGARAGRRFATGSFCDQGGWARAHGNGLEDLAAFFDDVEVVGREVMQSVLSAGRPGDLDRIGPYGLVETEVHAEV